MQSCLVELSHLGLLNISGEDAKSFLQGQLTCHVGEVSPTQSRLGGYCNLKGRLQCIFRLIQLPNPLPDYYLFMPQAMIPLIQQILAKYAIFSKVALADKTSRFERLGIYGPTTLLSKALNVDLSELEINGCLLGQTPGEYFLYRVPDQRTRYLLLANPETMVQLRQQLEADFPSAEVNQWELLEIQAGLPMIYPQTIDHFLPHHINLAILGGISFNKGCYLGQEIIARMHYKGKIKKHLYRAFVAGSNLPQPGEPLFVTGEQEPKGMVVRAAPTSGGCELLVMLEDDFAHFEGVFLSHSTAVQPLSLPYSI